MAYPFEPPDFFDNQERLYNIIGFREDQRDTFWNPDFDPSVHQAFYDYWYNDELSRAERSLAWEDLVTLLYLDYGLDFEDLWDWDAFREWYDSV
jgi:hypothetical protein